MILSHSVSPTRTARHERAHTCSTSHVSTESAPPILSMSCPQRPITCVISLRCAAMSPGTMGTRSTSAPTTASRTRRSGTLLAMRSVLSSTDALSTSCPSANARSSDCATSALNSLSAAASESAERLSVCAGCEREEREDVRERGAKEDVDVSPSVSLPLSSESSASDGTRSDAESPGRDKVSSGDI